MRSADRQRLAFNSPDACDVEPVRPRLAKGPRARCPRTRGRIQSFRDFAGMTIDSTFRPPGEVVRLPMTYAEPQMQIEFDDFAESPGDPADIGVIIKL